jgi:serine/threonine protein kinase
LIELLKKSGVASPQKLAQASSLALPTEPQKAAATLVEQGILTRFQAQQLLAGRHKGFRLGSYAILDLLGRGGMGAVYLAEHLSLHRKVAIKVLIPGKNEDQKKAVEAFQREARAVAALDHPNIVRIFDVAAHNETPFLVMEYVEGESLQQVLDRNGAIPYATATDYIAQVAAGLQHAHERGFVHRDIKPANLMRGKDGLVKILDMGLAHSPTADGSAHPESVEVAGTADFLAPEQGMNHPTDSRADIYSLGATFFALITGKPPFDGETTAQKLLQHQLKSAPKLNKVNADVPVELSEAVAKMLEKKPDHRFQTPAEVIAAIAPWVENNTRLVAGLSRTNVGQGSSLQTTLAEITKHSLRRSSSSMVALAEPAEVKVDASQASQETGSLSGTNTYRGPAAPKKIARPKRGRIFTRERLIYAVIGVISLALGILTGWLVFGR